MSQRRHLITSALPAADGSRQLGNLVGSMLPADAYARFLRARGDDVLFVCGADEHGTPAELAAAKAGLDVAEYCHQQHQTQAQLAREFGLSFDVFGRSSAARSREQTGYFARRLEEEGFLEARSMREVFSPISGGRDLEARDTRQLFLLRSKLAGRLRSWLEERSDWPPLARSIALERLDEGLGDRSITQDLAWGVPVERPEFEEKVYCAWFDAPIAYIGATREWADSRGEPDAWRKWWRASDEVRYVQFMAKDEVPFHTVDFPCAVMGSGEDWKLVDYLKAFHRLTYYGAELSTGDEAGVFIDHALELLPADCWRYCLLANAPEADDTSFSWEMLAVAVNEDLAGTFGNFVNRSLTFADRHFGGEVPSGGEPGPPELELLEELERLVDAYTERMGALEFREAIARLRAIWSLGNAYFERKQPWTAIGEDPDDAALTVRFCVNLVSLFARLSAPTMPFTADRVLDVLGVPDAERGWPSAFRADDLPPAHRFRVPPPLFHRISRADVERWRLRFGAEPG